ncbi:hypothetical protein O181_077753 [Austropuccinia psidii MF-1]|uniref:Integrase catalytic domain-containing protein n=1 Tax=Austropuccinia psidii MF-1 TaxID=1389203 RepID=A0A9Q3FDE0_9BASI|nr:hypothetical protein [Austropuccinia psidii MF-1]
MKDPSSFINNSVILSHDGSNFEEWKDGLNLSLEMIFPPKKNYCDDLDNFNTLKPLEETSLRNLIIKTTNADFYRSLLAKDKDVKQIFKAISDRCCQTTRSSALEYIYDILSLINVDSTKAHEKWLSIYTKLQQFNLNASQIYGLFLQATVASSSSSLGNLFRQNVHQALNREKVISSFEDVSNVIKDEINNTKRLEDNNTNATIMALQVNRQSDNRTIISQHGNVYRHPNASLLPHNQNAIQRYGSKCVYCHKEGHWYVDCKQYEKDFKDKGLRLTKLPRKFQHLGSNTIVPNAQTSIRTAQLDTDDNEPQIIHAQHITDVDENQILLDSGASAHVSGKSPFLFDVVPLSRPISLLLADPNTVLHATGIGRLCIPLKEGELNVDSVYVCSSISGTLLSLGRLVTKGFSIIISGTSLQLLSNLNTHFSTQFKNYCWYLQPQYRVSAISTNPLQTSFSWHSRLGHASDQRCAKSKGALRRPDLGSSIIPYNNVLDLVVSDVVGPINANDSPLRYFVTMRDHKSTYVLSKSIVARTEVVPTLQQWLEFFKTNRGRYPKFVRTDNAKEYMSAAFSTFCDSRGIKLVPTVPYTPTDNGEAERLNRTIGESARTMLHSSGLPDKFWSYAYHFGTKAIIQIPSATQPKLSQRAFEAILIGYPASGRGWVFYLPSNRSIIHSTQAVFPDTLQAPLVKSGQPGKMSLDTILNSISMKLGEIPTNNIINQHQHNIDNTIMIADMNIPNNIKDAMKSPDSSQWIQAANSELHQFDKLNVWTAVDPLPNTKVLGARWVFALKHDSHGKIIKHKARYVVKGYNQRPGQDFVDCYAPTASLVTLRLILTLKIQQQLHMTTFDVSGAYLHSPIEEEIYVKAPTELRPELKTKVMKLNKALYGTKQAARCWWLFFKSIMQEMSLQETEIEPSLYLYKHGSDCVIVWMHVDDGIILANSFTLLSKIQKHMDSKLMAKWNNNPDKIVGIRLQVRNDEITMDQHLLATQIINRYTRKYIVKSTPLPLLQTDLKEGDQISIKEYQHFIGSLMYLATGSRPDLTFSINFLARYNHSPTDECWKLLDHVIGYLKNTIHESLRLKPTNEQTLELWTDSNWGGSYERSTSVGIIKYAGCPVQWISKRQKIVAMSTCAAEYVAMGDTGQHLAHLINVLRTFNVEPHSSIHCDNQAAILITSDNTSRKRTKYLTRAFFFINDLVRQENIKLDWVSTKDQIGDIFTKSLSPNQHRKFLTGLNLCSWEGVLVKRQDHKLT